MSLRFSATIGCYKNDNPEDFKAAFLSIYNQSLRPNEIIITVDGPIPDVLNVVVNKFEQDYQAVVLRSTKNRGLGLAHALAINAAKYDYIAIMDADDISLSDRFEKQILELEKHPELDIIGGQIEEFIDEPDNIIGMRHVPLSNDDIKRYFKKRCPFNHQTIILRKQSVIQAGNYMDWHYNEDYFLYCRMMLNNPSFYNLPDVLVKVRVGNEMYKRRGGWRYFKSESKLQTWMLKKKLINFSEYTFNVFIRLCVQVLMPNWLRGFVFTKLFRKSK